LGLFYKKCPKSSKLNGRNELKYYINYADVLQLRVKLPYVASCDKNEKSHQIDGPVF